MTLNSATPPEGDIPNWLGGDSEMAARISALDWSTTALRSLETFPQSLRSALSIMLSSKAYIAIFWGTDLIKFYNDAYAALIGAKHPTILGQPAREGWREIWDVLEPLLDRVMATGEGVYGEDRLFVIDRHGYSEEAYFDISYDPIRNESGQVGGVFCIVKEMTRRVIGDRRLQTLRHLSTQTATAKTADAACHAAAVVLNSNVADLPFVRIYRLNGDRKAHLISTAGIPSGLNPRLDLTSATTLLPAAMAQVMQTGKPAIIHDLPDQFGTDLPNCSLGAIVAKPHTAIVLPLSRSDGQPPIGFLVTGISPFLTLDSAYQDFLELVAASITTGITNACAYEEERQRAEALAKLDHAKTSFFSNISHEFRTPLTLMLSPLEQTIAELDGILPAKARSQLELVQRNGTRLLKLVNTLLDFSRIEAGRAQTHYEPTDLADYTVELASLFQSAVEQAGLQLQVDCPPLPEPVYVDRSMWEKIVLNLLSNALKFTFEGAISVALHPVGNQVELSVRDTGIGIPAAEIPKLFERFHRIAEARGRTFEGTGIGLSLVQELVQLQGGTIAVESTVGQGSTFRVRLLMGTAHLANPLTHVDAPGVMTSGAKSYVQEALGWLPEQRSENDAALSLPIYSEASVSALARILVADDNSEMRNYLSRILSQLCEVETVANGEAALAAIHDRTPDLVLSDVMMPGMDGFELLRQLRSNAQTRDLPILLLSARTGEEAAVEGLEAGADDYLVKPFNARELLARVRANLELGRSRQAAARRRLDAIVSSVPDFIYTFDLAGQFTYINKPLLDLWQKSYAEAIGKNFFELDYPPELATRLQEQIQQVISTGQPLKDETPYTSALGTRVYEYIFVPLFDAEGAVEAVAGTTRDITERKQTEAALRQSEERYRTLFTSIDQGFCIIEMMFDEEDTPIDYRFLEVNSTFEQKSGLVQVIGKRMLELVPTHEKYWFEIYGKVALTGEPIRAENYAAALNRWFEVYAYRTGQPEERKVAVLFQDISDRKSLEAAREQLLQREKAARETAETANRIKDEFLAVLSHELRSPLNPILGWAKLLKMGRLNATKTAEALNTIERNAKLQSQLIEDLLDVSRILQGKLRLNVAPVALTPVVEAALETIRLAAEAKHIQLQTVFDLANGQVSGDAGRLQQVVWNLLSNAVKFTPEQGRVEVHLTQVDHAAQLQVIDTGKGIRPDFLPYVFEHFRQEDGATTRKFGGLGLGLAIVRQLVELHGGTVAVESAGEGQGATFTVRLPLLGSRESGVGSREENAESSLSPPHAPLTGLKILVVDDEPDSRDFVAFVLEQAGADVVALASASDVLQTISHIQPALLISDIGMPEIDGYMLMQYIRTQLPAPTCQVRAIALTAYAGEVNERQVLKAGFQKHLAKPIDPTELVTTASRLLRALPYP